MVAWVGAKILNQGFPLWKGAAYLATCYCGVVLSDVVRAPAPAPAAPPLFGCSCPCRSAPLRLRHPVTAA
jgi:hypothetical protein